MPPLVSTSQSSLTVTEMVTSVASETSLTTRVKVPSPPVPRTADTLTASEFELVAVKVRFWLVSSAPLVIPVRLIIIRMQNVSSSHLLL